MNASERKRRERKRGEATRVRGNCSVRARAKAAMTAAMQNTGMTERAEANRRKAQSGKNRSRKIYHGKKEKRLECLEAKGTYPAPARAKAVTKPDIEKKTG